MGRTSNFPLLWESLVLWPCSSYFLNRFGTFDYYISYLPSYCFAI